jgi:hypothetical protein
MMIKKRIFAYFEPGQFLITYHASLITKCLLSSFGSLGHWNLVLVWDLVLGIWDLSLTIDHPTLAPTLDLFSLLLYN